MRWFADHRSMTRARNVGPWGTECPPKLWSSGLTPVAIFLVAMLTVERGEARTFVVGGNFVDVHDLHDINPGDGECDAGGGRCNLRAAIEESNALPGPDRIELRPGTYPMSFDMGELQVSDIVHIIGTGSEPEQTLIWGSGRSRVLHVRRNVGSPRPYLHLRNLTVHGGVGVDPGGSGGGLRVGPDGSAWLFDVIFQNNKANWRGGAITVQGRLWLQRSVLKKNGSVRSGCGGVSGGGAIYVDRGGHANIDSSLIADNQHTKGGGIMNNGRLTIRNSTISNNTAYCYGAGLLNYKGESKIAFTTIVGNRLTGRSGTSEEVDDGLEGSGIHNGPILINQTLEKWARVTVGNSIIVHNTSDAGDEQNSDCQNQDGRGAVFFTAGYNVIGNFDGCSGANLEAARGASSTDRVGTNAAPVDALLERDLETGVLVLRSGTYAILRGSPAVDLGPLGPGSFTTGDPFFDCPPRDQRRRVRPGAGSRVCDAGAYELTSNFDWELVPPRVLSDGQIEGFDDR